MKAAVSSPETITARLDEVYTNEQSALDPIIQSIQTRSIEKDVVAKPTIPRPDSTSG